MTTHARRSLRATAAVAGITAVGVGLAGPAFAAPAASERPSTDDVAPAAPDAGSTPNVVDDHRPAPRADDLPPAFTIEDGGVYAADHEVPTRPAADKLPSTDDAVDVDDNKRDTNVEFQTSAPQERDSALQQLDGASMSKLLHATEGNDVRA